MTDKTTPKTIPKATPKISSTTPSKLEIPCPRCKKPSQLMNNVYRPFCSEQCRMIDLGHWANEDYKIN